MNAINLLMQDHTAMKRLFEQFESSSYETEHRSLFAQISAALQAHAHVEEAIFYPAVQAKKNRDLAALVDGYTEAHQRLDVLLDEIQVSNDAGEDLRPQVAQLELLVQGHVDEEEGVLFPRVLEMMDELELERLADELMAEKQSFSPVTA